MHASAAAAAALQASQQASTALGQYPESNWKPPKPQLGVLPIELY